MRLAVGAISPPAARRFVPLCACLVISLLLAAGTAVAQSITYHYDGTSRLKVMVSKEGIAEWHYDEVGNITKVTVVKFAEITEPLALVAVDPLRGGVGTQVTLVGKNFGPTPNDNVVRFGGGALAPILSASPTVLVVSVPQGAATGKIQLTVGANSVLLAQDFVVLRAPVVSPLQLALFPGEAATLSADQPARWAVGGIPGGAPAFGTITSTGQQVTYTAPASVPVAGLTTAIEASTLEDSNLKGTAVVEVVRPALQALAVSVAHAPSLTANPLVAPLVTLAHQPVVTAVEDAAGQPARLPAGTSQTVRLRGAGFSGGTGLAFDLAGSADPNLTVTGMTVVSDAELTAQLAVAPGAPAGSRVARVTVGAATSTAQGTGGNLVEIAP